MEHATKVAITNATGETVWEGTDKDLTKAARAMKAKDRKSRAPVKNTPTDEAVADKSYRVTAKELRSFIERFERLESEKKDIADQQKEVMAEAKARGYDTKVMRKLIAERKREPDDVAEEQAVMDLYREALGM